PPALLPLPLPPALFPPVLLPFPPALFPPPFPLPPALLPFWLPFPPALLPLVLPPALFPPPFPLPPLLEVVQPPLPLLTGTCSAAPCESVASPVGVSSADMGIETCIPGPIL